MEEAYMIFEIIAIDSYNESMAIKDAEKGSRDNKKLSLKDMMLSQKND